MIPNERRTFRRNNRPFAYLLIVVHIFVAIEIFRLASNLKIDKNNSFTIKYQPSNLVNNSSFRPPKLIEPIRTISKVKNDIILIRAIGNSLPPRHAKNQSLVNLAFILEHEEEINGLQKHWVLNRIIDIDIFNQLVQLLHDYNQTFSVVHFNLSEFEKIGYDYNTYGTPDILHHDHLLNTMDGFYRRNIMESIYGPKNLYTTNINGVRNMMIHLGKEMGAKWILPWDGNCFLTFSAWKSITSALETHGEYNHYFYTPMDRVHRNQDLLNKNYQPKPIEEPQVIVREDAMGRFDERLRYGRRNKVAFLMCLEMKGVWDEWIWYPWEKEVNPKLKNKKFSDRNQTHGTPCAGWISRLASGNIQAEKKGHDWDRFYSRSIAIEKFIDELNERAALEIHQFTPDKLLFYHEPILLEQKRQFQSTHQTTQIHSIINALLFEANQSLDAIPDSLDEMMRNVTILTLASYFSDNYNYSHQAAHYIKEWFLEYNATKIQLPFKNASRMKQAYFFYDALRLLNRWNVLSSNEMLRLKQWFQELLYWTIHSDVAKNDYTNKDYTSLFVDLQTIAMAAFVNDSKNFVKTSHHVISRLFVQVDDKGNLIQTLGLSDCEHHQMRNLQGWTILNRLVSSIGINVYTTSSCPSRLCNAISSSNPLSPLYQPHPCTFKSSFKPNIKRWEPIQYPAKFYCSSLSKQETQDKSINNMEFLYPSSELIAPFWMLGHPQFNLNLSHQ